MMKRKKFFAAALLLAVGVAIGAYGNAVYAPLRAVQQAFRMLDEADSFAATSMDTIQTRERGYQIVKLRKYVLRDTEKVFTQGMLEDAPWGNSGVYYCRDAESGGAVLTVRNQDGTVRSSASSGEGFAQMLRSPHLDFLNGMSITGAKKIGQGSYDGVPCYEYALTLDAHKAVAALGEHYWEAMQQLGIIAADLAQAASTITASAYLAQEDGGLFRLRMDDTQWIRVGARLAQAEAAARGDEESTTVEHATHMLILSQIGNVPDFPLPEPVFS